MDDVIIRDMSESDIGPVVSICDSAWRLSELSDDAALRGAIPGYFMSFRLRRCNFLKVAESGGKVIGFVGGRIFDESQSQMDKIFQGMERDTRKVLSDRFPSFIKDMMTMDDYHRKTISRHRRECNGEMELLAVDPAHMGKGIGSRLAGEIFRTLRSKGAVVSFFYINDLCKVSFCLRPCYEKTDETEMTLGKMKVGSYIYSVNLNYFK